MQKPRAVQANYMAVTTPEEYLELLRKSQLLEPEQFAEAEAALQPGDNVIQFARRLVAAELLTEWQAAQIVAGRCAFYIGKYLLLQLLGRGGMGSVFLAEHTAMNRRVALKTISQNVSKEPGAIEQFLTEARAIAALDHPNIVQAYSVDNEGDRFYLVMEYIDGQDLEQTVQSEGPLDPHGAADYIRQAAEGLQHGHTRGMIHCDIKPSNLLVNQSSVVKIVDMGLSRLEDPKGKGVQDKKEQGVLGSVDYLAPEQAMDTDFNHQVDIYALGCTLYFLLTGQPPFPEGSLHEKLMRHQTMDPKGIAEFRSDVPDDLIAICEKMMAKEPEDRYQSASEISIALAQFPAPKRRAKPAAPLKSTSHLLRAQALPEPGEPVAVDGLPIIDTGGSGVGRGSGVGTSGSGVRRKPAATGSSSSIHVGKAGKGSSASGKGLPAAAAGLLATPRGRIIAAAAAGGALLLVLAILIPFLLSSSKSQQTQAGEDESWISVGEGPAPPDAAQRQLDADLAGPKPPKPPEPPAPSKGPVNELVFDFETGDLQGWRVSKGEFGEKLVNDRDSYPNRQKKEFGKQGKYFLDTSVNGTGKVVGNIDSPVFVIEGPTIRLLVAGSKHRTVWVRLLPLRGKFLRQTKGGGERFFKEVTWTVGDLIGKRVYIRVLDGNGPATVLLDNVRIQGHIDEKATDKRFAKLNPSGDQAVATVQPSKKAGAGGAGKGSGAKKPGGQKPAQKPKPKTKKANPFKNLGKTGGLAIPTRSLKAPAEPHVLGKLDLAEDDKVNLFLLGGANAAPRGRTYEMEFDEAKNTWVIRVNSASASGKQTSRTDIARIAVRDQNLLFAWLEGATPEKAGYLFNCGLDINVEGTNHFLPLGPPQQVKPITVNLDSKESRATLPAGRLPAPELLQLQVTRLEGPFPKPKFEPGNTVAGTEEVKVVLESEGLPKIWFLVKLDMKARSASVNAAARFQVTGGSETVFEPRAAQELMQRINVQGNIVEKEAKTARSKKAKGELGKQRQGIKDAVGELGKLSEFYKTANRKGAIHFRIFTMLDSEHKLTLMETGNSAPRR